MKHYIIVGALITGAFTASCQHENKTNTNPTTASPSSVENDTTINESLTVNSDLPLVVGHVTVHEGEYGDGCITSYHKKGDDISKLIFVQTGSKTDEGWVNFMTINGKREVFLSVHDDSKSTEFGYSLYLENARYLVDVVATVGAENVEADAAEASGKMTVKDKKTNQQVVVDFEGGTGC